LAGGGFVLGIEPLRPPAEIVFRCPKVEVFNVLAHLAAEAAGLVMERAPDDEIFCLQSAQWGSIPRKHSQSMMKHAMRKMVLGFRS
jgi:hypothetical protein